MQGARAWLSEHIGKGEISNFLAFVVMVVGITLTLVIDAPHDSKGEW